jgi:integrase
MRALISPDLVRKLPAEDKDIRDTKLTGFVLRCRASGAHSYLVQLGRGRSVTIGRVAEMAPEAARLTADSMLSSVSRETLKLMADDPAMNLRDARARVRSEMRGPRRNRRATWRQFIDDHYEPWAIANRKTGAATVERLRRRFADFDMLRLADLSSFTIERWRSARLRTGVKPATVNRDFAALRGALSMAVEWRVIKTHPMDQVKDTATDKLEHIRYLDDAEENRLRDALTARDNRRRAERESGNRWRRERGHDEWPAYAEYTDNLHPLTVLAMNTGLRFGELTGLDWKNVDLTLAQITVRSETAKSGRARRLPLNTEAVRVLTTWKRAKADGEGYVFPGVEGGRLTEIKTAWAALLKAAKITAFRFHDTRHHFASRLVMAGVDLNTVRELLGHAGIAMTLRYSHLAPEHKAAAVAKLAQR